MKIKVLVVKKQPPKRSHFIKKNTFQDVVFYSLRFYTNFLPHLFKTTSSNVVFYTPSKTTTRMGGHFFNLIFSLLLFLRSLEPTYLFNIGSFNISHTDRQAAIFNTSQLCIIYYINVAYVKINNNILKSARPITFKRVYAHHSLK